MLGGWALRQEICTANANGQVADLIQRMEAGAMAPPPLIAECRFLPPLRARTAYAIATAIRARPIAEGQDRQQMLDHAAAHIEIVLRDNPQSADAEVTSAFIAALRPSAERSPERPAIVRSYRLAPFLPAGGGWRLGLAFADWANLPSDVQHHAVEEAVAIARISPSRKSAIFEMARASAAYAPFLSSWHMARSADADRAGAAATP